MPRQSYPSTGASCMTIPHSSSAVRTSSQLHNHPLPAFSVTHLVSRADRKPSIGVYAHVHGCLCTVQLFKQLSHFRGGFRDLRRRGHPKVVHETIKEPQLPKHKRGLDVILRVTRCTGHVSANTRPHQLHWGDSGSVGATWHTHATIKKTLLFH